MSNLVVYHGLLKSKVTNSNRHYVVDAALESLKTRLDKNKSVNSELGGYGCKKFLQLDKKANLEANEEKVKEAKKWDGRHGIVSNLKASI